MENQNRSNLPAPHYDHRGTVPSISAVAFISGTKVPYFEFALAKPDPPIPVGKDSVFYVNLLNPSHQALVTVIMAAYATQAELVIRFDRFSATDEINWAQLSVPPCALPPCKLPPCKS